MFSEKRYVFVCAGCGCLDDASRRDVMTCSPACRVKAQRSGELRRRRALALEFDIEPSSMGHAAAAQILCPDLAALIKSGKRRADGRPMTFDDIQPDLGRAFNRAIMDMVRNVSAET